MVALVTISAAIASLVLLATAVAVSAATLAWTRIRAAEALLQEIQDLQAVWQSQATEALERATEARTEAIRARNKAGGMRQ